MVCLQQHKSNDVYKALLYECYARRGPIGAESKEQGGRAPLKFLSLSGQSGALWHLDLITNIQTKYRDVQYNNEQVSRVFIQNLS